MEVFFGIVAWTVLSAVVMIVANVKGRNGCSWFFISLLLSPILGIIILLCVGDSDEKKDEDYLRAASKLEKQNTPDQPKVNKTSQEKAIEELENAKKLLELDVITQEEYEAKKAELMPYLRK